MIAKTTTIDITPTWEALLPSLVHLAVNGTTAESRKMGMEQLLILARHADSTIADKNTEIKKYDEKGNLIHSRDSDGFEWWSEYDEKGNVIHSRNSDGYELWREYDAKGNVIHSRTSDGVEEKY
jgi:YD repeat-containing protein